MKTSHRLLILYIIFSAIGANAQLSNKPLTIRNTADTRYLTGYLISMNDSTLFMSTKKSRTDTLAIHYRSVYSVQQGRPTGRGVLIGSVAGLLTGAFIGVVIDVGQDATSSLTLGLYEPDQTNYTATGAILGLLAGGITGGLIGAASQKEPITVNNSKPLFNEIQPSLLKYASSK